MVRNRRGTIVADRKTDTPWARRPHGAFFRCWWFEFLRKMKKEKRRKEKEGEKEKKKGEEEKRGRKVEII